MNHHPHKKGRGREIPKTSKGGAPGPPGAASFFFAWKEIGPWGARPAAEGPGHNRPPRRGPTTPRVSLKAPALSRPWSGGPLTNQGWEALQFAPIKGHPRPWPCLPPRRRARGRGGPWPSSNGGVAAVESAIPGGQFSRSRGHLPQDSQGRNFGHAGQQQQIQCLGSGR